MTLRLLKFFGERRGAAGVEFALLALVFAGVILGIIDFGRALWEYNSAAKACQVGVRFAVVNNMVPKDLQTWDGFTDGGIPGGNEILSDAIDPNLMTCDATGCDPADWSYDPLAYDAIYDAMAAHYPQLGTAANPNPQAIVEVTYEHIGKGFSGNPFGPDVWPLTTVSIRGIQFEFSTPLISAVLPFEFPKCSATLTGEDFETCPDGKVPLPCS